MIRKYEEELDVYSGIAILFVVILHSNAYYLANILKLSSYIKGGALLNLTDKIVHISVPMFIFIAGYKYMKNNKEEPYVDYFKKKISKVFKPFFLISCFYLSYHWIDVFFRRLTYTGVYDIQYVVERFAVGFIKMFLGYNFAYQFWYIPMYLFISLTYPVIRNVLRNTVLRFSFFIFLAVLWEVLILARVPFLSNKPYPLAFIYYFFIYEMGCLFYERKSFHKNPIIIILLYLTILTAVCMVKNPVYNRLIYDLALVPAAVLAFYYIALWVKSNQILMILGKCSFYIYMFHEPLVLSSLSRSLLRQGLYKSYIVCILLVPVTILISIVIHQLISISALKRTVFIESRKQ